MLTDPAPRGDRPGRTERNGEGVPAPPDIPDSLEPFVVNQDPSRYSLEDQAVWRFVLLALLDRLKDTAHPSYARGLTESGISPERIPSVVEMNRCLAQAGWGAVCVDGFIPPRAFQDFQARGILPIAAEIRAVEHLPYTPAPDIIHEAAGHAPILIDPIYAAYVRAIGSVGSRAFSSSADARVDAAVRRLSEVKEPAEPDPRELERAELELVAAYAGAKEPSEAARMSRLYWWTAEYGLVGTPREYRLYGAGLLSSLGESHFCHAPEVDKRVLSPACTSVAYDITRPQPQLFVARDFEHLGEVLEQVDAGLAYRVGGRYALDKALESQELCTLSFQNGVGVIGRLRAALTGHTGEPALLELEPHSVLCAGSQLIGPHAGPYFVPLGPLADGTRLQALTLADLRRHGTGGRVELSYRSGVRLSGGVLSGGVLGGGVLGHSVNLGQFKLEWQGRTLYETRTPYPLLLVDEVLTATPGASAEAYWGLAQGVARREPGQPRPSVPKPKRLGGAAAQRNALYARLLLSSRQAPLSTRPALEALHAELGSSHPHEWLLRWNLLERAQASGNAALERALVQELTALETHYEGRFPIKLGLDYLRARRRG